MQGLSPEIWRQHLHTGHSHQPLHVGFPFKGWDLLSSLMPGTLALPLLLLSPALGAWLGMRWRARTRGHPASPA